MNNNNHTDRMNKNSSKSGVACPKQNIDRRLYSEKYGQNKYVPRKLDSNIRTNKAYGTSHNARYAKSNKTNIYSANNMRRVPVSGKNSAAHKNKLTARIVIGRAFLIIFTLIIMLAITLVSVCACFMLGPSTTARNKLVSSTLEMSAAKWVPGVFLSDETIEEIVKSNEITVSDDVTDPDMIQIADDSENKEDNDEWSGYPDGIRIDHIKGNTYRGYVMLVKDPSRVYVATSSDFTSGQPGLRILDALAAEGAVAATNAGGFPDDGGVGAGNVPIGLTISKGRILWGGESAVWKGVIGFDNNNVLIVGNMSGSQALEKGIRDCITFGPILIVNGEPSSVSGDTGSLNPRTAIGQRADGTVLMVCIDGRMSSSLGASYTDLINIMLEYGAINAANLDGGSSTHMAYNGELINVSSSLYGPRRMPTFIMVKAG